MGIVRSDSTCTDLDSVSFFYTSGFRNTIYQVTEIKVLDEETPNTLNGSKRANGYVHVAKLLKEIEKKNDSGKKVLAIMKKVLKVTKKKQIVDYCWRQILIKTMLEKRPQ